MTDSPDSTTSVAVLTPAGRGAVATLVVEGDGALGAVDEAFQPAAGGRVADHPIGRILFGRWGGAAGEELVVCRRTATRVEIHCHGGAAAARAIVGRLVDTGCRHVPWTEWLERSTTDPIRADAALALALATTRRTAAILVDQHEGALRRTVDQAAQRVADRQFDSATARLREIVRYADVGAHLDEPWRVVLIGLPNVGKSSLLNALVGYGRAIVLPEPGTTCDVVTATTALDGWPVELADTAGRRSGGGAVEQEGIRLADARLAAADLVVWIADGSTAPTRDETPIADRHPEALRVVNKCDLPAARPAEAGSIRTSAVRGDGIDSLVRAMAARLVPDPPPAGAAVPFRPWQVDAIRQAIDAIERGDPGEAIERLGRFGPKDGLA